MLAGNLRFTGGGAVSGSITDDGGLQFGGPSFSFSASSSISAAGVDFLPGMVVTEAGAYDVSQKTTVYYDTAATFTAPITDLGSSLSVGGTLNLPGQSFSFTSLTISSSGGLPHDCSTAGVAASVMVTGSMGLEGWATITGFGTLNIADGATLAIGGYQNAETLDGIVLENAGTAAMASTNTGALELSPLALQNGAGIDNQATGTFSFPTNYSAPSNAADYERWVGHLLQQ